jgi:hypothetical protein
MGLKVRFALEAMRVRLVATTHLPGTDNTVADTASRQWMVHHRRLEWPFCPETLRRIVVQLGTHLPEIDAFATAANSKCPTFWSLHPDPLAAGTDAMTQKWGGRSLLINPPFGMMQRVVNKLIDGPPAHAIVIAPDWPNQPWHRRLMALTARSMLAPPEAVMSGPNASEALLNPKWRVRVHLLRAPPWRA